jgi:hypothetical protein
METSHHKPKHNHMHEIARKLQAEVDVILSNVDEKMLFAEFKQEEIFDIQNGDKQQVVRHTLDERITMRRSSAGHSTSSVLERRAAEARNKVTKLRRLSNYLFKPLDY